MDFTGFWALYPRRDAKKDAQKAWDKLNPDPELQQQIETALAWQVLREQWQDDRYIPLPASWLRGERWTDEPKVERRQSVQGIQFECPHTPPCEKRWACGSRQLRDRQAS